MKFRLLLPFATFALGGACTPTDPPPEFNAIDRSITCEAGKVGWDFTTGGGAQGEAYTSEPIRGIRIQKATFGANCDLATAANAKTALEKRCNSLDQCDWVLPTGPAGGLCANSAELEWTCGVESPVYKISKLGNTGQVIPFKCGAKITVTSAFFGLAVDQIRTDKLAAVKSECDGLRRCDLGDVFAKYGEPKVLNGLAPNLFWLKYTCGSNPTPKVSGVNAPPSPLECDAEPDPKSPKIAVQTATYGKNCGSYDSSKDSAKTLSSAQCDGRVTCAFDYNADPAKATDPAFGCHKELAVDYRCGADPTLYSYRGPATAAPTASLACQTQKAAAAEGIRISAASYGANCGVAKGNWTTSVNATCSGKATCDFSPDTKAGDPKPGCAKDFSVEYKCGAESTTYTASIAAEASGKKVSLSCAPPVKIVSASYGSVSCTVSKGTYTDAVATACDSKRGSCTYAIAPTGDPAPGCAKDFEVQYRCGADPAVKIATVAGEALGKSVTLECPAQPASAYKKCIPEFCKGKSRRATDMSCVDDSTIPVVSTFEMQDINFVPSEENRASPLALRGDTSYSVRARYKFGGPATSKLDTRLAIWATDVFQDNVDATKKVEGFACLIGHVYLKANGSTAVNTTDDFKGKLSPECFAQKNTWGDAANVLGVSEQAVRAQYKYVGSKIHASYDPNGDTVYFANRAGAPTDAEVKAAAMPNPPGFFYSPALGWVNLIKFYQQREVTVTSNASLFTFVPATRIELGMESATLRSPSLDIGLFSSQSPVIDVDFNWYLSGANKKNPYMPGSYVNGTPSLANRHLVAYLEMFPASTPNDFISFGAPNGVPLETFTTTGDTVTTRSVLGEAAVKRLFNEWKDKNTFGVRVCMQVDGLPRTQGTEQCLPAATVAGTAYKACIAPNHVCVQTGALVVNRDYYKYSVQAQSPKASIANAKDSTSGDTRMSDTSSSTQTGDCTQPANTTDTSCKSFRRNSDQGDGEFGRTYYSSTAQTSRDETDSNETSTMEGNGEMLGFQVIDMEDAEDEEPKVNGVWEDKKPPVKITIKPNWEAIIFAEKEATKAVVPVRPTFESGRYANRDGIGIGLGGTVPFLIGPIPGELSMSATVGLSIALVFEIQFSPEEAYPCIGPKGTKCYKTDTDKFTLAEAARHCAAAGGRLAEIVTPTDRTALDTATAGATEEFWTGAVSSYKFDNPGCAYNMTPDCAKNATASFRWGGSNVEFASGKNVVTYQRFGFTVIPVSATFVVNSFDVTKTSIGQNAHSFSSFAPSPAGLAYHGSGRTMKAHDGRDKLSSVCEFDAAPHTRFAGYKAALELGAGAGVGVSVCVPKEEFGVCISGSVNFVEVGLKPELSYSQFTLLDVNKNRFGSRGNVNVSVPWDVTLLHAELAAELKLFLFTVSWTIIEFPGYKVAEGNLFSYDWPMRENY